MLALEEAFNVEFPDRLLKRATFQTIANLRAAVGELTSAAA
jgi:acyl carrier protein